MLAWLHATPKPPANAPPSIASLEVYKHSRFKLLKKKGSEPAMPPNSAPCIIDWLTEMGITESDGMGLSPLSWREIDAWCTRTAIDLPPWAARLIKKLSVVYLSEGRRAEDETCPPPWRGEVTEGEINAELALLDDILG